MHELFLIKENARNILNSIRKKNTDLTDEEKHELVVSTLKNKYTMDNDMLNDVESYVSELISNCTKT